MCDNEVACETDILCDDNVAQTIRNNVEIKVLVVKEDLINQVKIKFYLQI